ncbi:RNA methyltransferase [Nocardioides sp. GY 10127]|uniref:TrmH family RNA methyltransferase n=1 Tax=Nocardioides sp. GY 10127 TaxID=2569762 RepID=UPI001F0EF96D|nr:RNA methyltransferase [Nocardioides sp. GY 10127]
MKDARRLSRRSERSERRLFLADGPKAVEGALERDGCLVEVFAAPEAHLAHPHLLAACEAAGVPWTLVEHRGIEALSDAVSPAGVVGVCRLLDRPLADVLTPPVGQERRLVALCADVRDPGNAGTVVRCADAAGADAVVLAGSSVDLHNPKTVRASVGSVFHLPVALEPDPLAAVRAAQAAGLTVLAADGAGEVDLFEADELLARPTAWLFGNEAWGLPEELAAAADHRVSIPIHGRAESLNLATAAALCLYASARAQRA